LFGFICVSKAHQDKIVALVLGTNISYLFFRMDNDQRNLFELLINCQ
jgi:hypothetical protein